jgi:hypothetical protein
MYLLSQMINIKLLTPAEWGTEREVGGKCRRAKECQLLGCYIMWLL